MDACTSQPGKKIVDDDTFCDCQCYDRAHRKSHCEIHYSAVGAWNDETCACDCPAGYVNGGHYTCVCDDAAKAACTAQGKVAHVYTCACICDDGSSRKSECEAAGGTWNDTTCSCDNCGAAYELDSNNVCQCTAAAQSTCTAQGKIVDRTDGCNCVCQDGALKKDYCEMTGGTWSEASCSCACPEGYSPNSWAQCWCDTDPASCGLNEWVSTSTCECVCKTGYADFGGECRPPACAFGHCEMTGPDSCDCDE